MDDSAREEVMNIAQYALIGFLPVVLFNKVVQKVVPEANEDKSSLEMSLEMIFQILLVFLGIYFLHRLVIYFPTYSGMKYSAFDPTHIVLIGLIILTSLSTKLGEKVAILMERANSYWNGTSSQKKQQQQKQQQQQQTGQITGNPMPSSPPPSQIQQQQPQQGPPSAFLPGVSDTIMAANEVIGGSGSFASF